MSIASNRYARALLDHLYPDRAEDGRRQLQQIDTALRDSAELRVILENPTVSRERRNQLLTEIGRSISLSQPVANFLMAVADGRRIGKFSDIVRAYDQLLDERLGVVPVDVTVASELDDVQTQKLVSRLETLTRKRVKMRIRVDENLIAGLTARIGDTIYDGSVRTQLRAFGKHLIAD